MNLPSKMKYNCNNILKIFYNCFYCNIMNEYFDIRLKYLIDIKSFIYESCIVLFLFYITFVSKLFLSIFMLNMFILY